jgi:acetoin utilization deacetylase AcuC-like enzyme
MLCHSGTFREMTRLVKQAAGDLCGGRLVVCLEGGYAPVYIPYCAAPVIETLAGLQTQIDDPMHDWVSNMGGQELLPHQEAVIERAAALVARLRSGGS